MASSEPNTRSQLTFSLLCLSTTSHFAFSFILYVEHARSKVQVNLVRRRLRRVFFLSCALFLFTSKAPDTVTIA
jgi:hypothetical protein